MKEVFLLYKEKYPEENVIVQNSSMSDEEREEFIDKFEKETENVIGFVYWVGFFRRN